MKLILAVSADGFVAKGPVDDMSWTGKLDKAIFKLLTLSGNNQLWAGYTTYCQMPILAHRTVHPISRDNEKGYSLSSNLFKEDDWLIGGQTVAIEAIKSNLIDELCLCHSREVNLNDGIKLSDEIRYFGTLLSKIQIDSKLIVEIRRKCISN